MDDARRVGDSLDPSQYAVHVTKTALLLERLAEDVAFLRTQSEINMKENGGLRSDFNSIKTDIAVYKESAGSRIDANAKAIEGIAERLRWLSRLVIGALLTGVIGGTIAMLFKLAGS